MEQFRVLEKLFPYNLTRWAITDGECWDVWLESAESLAHADNTILPRLWRRMWYVIYCSLSLWASKVKHIVKHSIQSEVIICRELSAVYRPNMEICLYVYPLKAQLQSNKILTPAVGLPCIAWVKCSILRYPVEIDQSLPPLHPSLHRCIKGR